MKTFLNTDIKHIQTQQHEHAHKQTTLLVNNLNNTHNQNKTQNQKHRKIHNSNTQQYIAANTLHKTTQQTIKHIARTNTHKTNKQQHKQNKLQQQQS